MKTKKIRIRQGFTIVELVIVIGVIGVLSAVLIPTFINLNNKANEAADQSLIKNLNTQLAIKRETEGKNTTMYGALQDALEAGYKVENLTPKGSKDIVWNQETDEFAQLESAPADAYKYWTVAKNANDLTKAYSSYLYFNAEGPLNIQGKGFDVGEYSNISVNYTGVTGSPRSIVMRTNGGSLNINAPEDTVSHYAALDDLDITAIAGSSYHEFGKVKSKATISQGRIVVENGADVPQVDVESATGAVIVTAKAETLINVDAVSAAQTNVEAEAPHVYVNGVGSEKISGSQASNVELPTIVSDQAQLLAAVNAKKGFIKLGADFSVAETVTFGYKSLLDFAGFTINAAEGTSQSDYASAVDNMTAGFVYQNKPLFVNNLDLTLTDTGEDGGVVSTGNLIVRNNAAMVINGGKYNSTLQIHKYLSGAPKTFTDEQKEYLAALNSTVVRGVIRSEKTGTLTVNDIEVNTTSDYGLISFGKTVINGGVVNSTSCSANGGYGYAVTCRDGEMTINSLAITGVHGGLCGDGGKLTVNNVDIVVNSSIAQSFYALYVAGEHGFPNVTINNGNFSGGYYGCAYIGNANDGGLGNFAMCTFNYGTFNGLIKVSKPTSTYGVGQLVVNGGRYTDSTISTRQGVESVVEEGGYYIVNKK